MKEENWFNDDIHNKDTDFHKWYKSNYHKAFPYTVQQVHMMSRNISGSEKMNKIIAVLDKYHNEFTESLFNSPLNYTFVDDFKAKEGSGEYEGN